MTCKSAISPVKVRLRQTKVLYFGLSKPYFYVASTRHVPELSPASLVSGPGSTDNGESVIPGKEQKKGAKPPDFIAFLRRWQSLWFRAFLLRNPDEHLRTSGRTTVCPLIFIL